jgi:hypothetical protein
MVHYLTNQQYLFRADRMLQRSQNNHKRLVYIIRKGWNLNYWCETVPLSAPRAPFLGLPIRLQLVQLEE